MKIKTNRSLAALLVGTTALVAPAFAFAQDTSATTVGAVVITGSRIPQPNLTSVSPITTVSAQTFKQTGATDIIDVLDQLPQVGTGLGNAPNPLSGSGGFTTVNLRNLGTVRTLVLEDGKRLMPGDPTLGGEAPDLDTIPAALVDRVEVTTGGASAVYGSDAVAGVVNFVMKHNFQGVQLDAQYGINEDNNDNSGMQALEKAFPTPAPSGVVWDGKTYNVAVTVGANAPDGKGNVTAFVAYRRQEPVYQSARDYSACQLSQAGGTPVCVGSSNSNSFQDQNPGGTGTTFSVSGNIFTSVRNQSTTPPKAFQANPFETLTKDDTRYQGGFFAHYEVAPWAEVYSDFSFMDDRSIVHAAPSALFKQNYEVNCNNPLLSTSPYNPVTKIGGEVGAICTNDGLGPNDDALLTIGRRDVEGGGRIYSFEHLSYKADVGVRGDFGMSNAFHYDIYGQYGRTQYNFSVQNDISVSKAQDALLDITDPDPTSPTFGQTICASRNAGCVPYNIFKDGGVTPAALAYILTSGTTTGNTQQQIVHADFGGDLGKFGITSPWATDGVGFNVGAEYRIDELTQFPDETSLSGDLSGAGGAAPGVTGSTSVRELFGEIRIPLIQDKMFAKSLSFDGGYRYSEYNLAGDARTYKAAFEWQPINDIRLRASYERAVRAPNINELFTPQEITNTSAIGTDPCSGQSHVTVDPVTHANVGGVAPDSLAQCLHTAGPLFSAAQLTAAYGNGIDVSVSGPVQGTDRISDCTAFQCGTVFGGNTHLTPETADTYSYGIVFTPSDFLPGFSASIDYFRINLANAISTFPITIAFSDCLDSGTHCDAVVRSTTGTIFGTNLQSGGYVSGTNVNIGAIKTEGVDFAANYHFDLDKLGFKDMGSISASFNGTYTEHLIFSFPQVGSYDCAGLYGLTCGNPAPKWKHQMRVTYTSPWAFSVSGQWRYFGEGSYDLNSSNPLIGNGPGTDTKDGHIPAFNYFDLSGSWTVHPGYVLRAGVNNIFDKHPPILDSGVTGSGTPNTYTNYDELGRVLFLGITANF